MSKSQVQKSRKPRADCTLTQDERDVLGRYKYEYKSEPNSKARGQIFKGKILPDIFNYWTDNGAVEMDSDETSERVKVRPQSVASDNNCWSPGTV